MSGPSRPGSKMSVRFSAKGTFLLAWIVLLGMVVCQGARLNSPNVGNATNMSPESTGDPSSLLPLRFRDDPDESYWSGGGQYDPPVKAPGLTDEEFNETWRGMPNTLKIGILMPYTPNENSAYRTTISRISLSVSHRI